MTNKPQRSPLAIRLLTVFLLLLSVFSVYFLKRWDIFSISLAVLLIIVIIECYRLLSAKIDYRFDKLEKYIKTMDNNNPKK